MADSTVTAQTVIDNSIARMKDPNDTQWTDAVLLNELNRAVDYIHRILINLNSPLAMSAGTVTIVADTQEYNLSGNLDNFWRMTPKGVYYSSGDPLTAITKEDAQRAGTTTTDSAPTAYYLEGDTIGLVYTPSSVSAVEYPTLYCRFYAQPTTLTLTDTMPYKNLFNEPASAFMSSIAMFKTDTPQAEYLAVYNALEQATVEIVRNRQ